mgnify:CR=1 FL=1
MIRKRLILFGFVSVLAFSTLPGCGCGAVQTSVPSETVSVEESTSSLETVTQEESSTYTIEETEFSKSIETETAKSEMSNANEPESSTDDGTESTVQETESEVASEAPSQTQTESQAPAETVPTPAPQETVPVDSLTEAQQKVVDQINQGQQQTGGTPVDNGGSAEADALLGGPPTAATNNRTVIGDLEITGDDLGLHAAD